eukprot:CAMPEP_0117480264 /NCGR_PEP_ID=MMETSP0784-20121206/12303_1 /TAXON_ID=39447 /ORGANISM="" /LENGTH=48 /DNA_ID= /DNA_START= /DNA_END= /DNA_ORIENTATION=
MILGYTSVAFVPLPFGTNSPDLIPGIARGEFGAPLESTSRASDAPAIA